MVVAKLYCLAVIKMVSEVDEMRRLSSIHMPYIHLSTINILVPFSAEYKCICIVVFTYERLLICLLPLFSNCVYAATSQIELFWKYAY